MKALLALAFLAVAAVVVDNTDDNPRPVKAATDITNPADVADVVAAGSQAVPASHAVGDALQLVVAFIALGVAAGIVYAAAASSISRLPARSKWALRVGLAAGAVTAWLVVGRFISEWNMAACGASMAVTVIVIDLAFGGPQRPAPVRDTADVEPDESWRDVIPPEVVIRPQRGGTATMHARTPTWRELQRMSRQVQSNVSVVSLAATWGTTPDTIAQWVRDYRLAEDRWEDTINGTAAAPGQPAGKDLSDEIRDTGWDAFAAATTMRLIDQQPDRGGTGTDVTLYELTSGPWTGERVVQVTDASTEDGLHRRIGIPVGRTYTDAIEAVASTFGLTADEYHPTRTT